ncbi:MAG: primosomal protein N' [Candidatus Methylopumilus sp.]|nr:primosomal protein N' [Candidatus Methylopumilus sp.]
MSSSPNHASNASQNQIVNVALDVPLERLFDYLSGNLSLRIGQRVEVPFGNRKMVGIVMGFSQHSDYALDKLKTISRSFDDEPILDETTFRLMRFCADYYQYPFGQALLAILPARLRQLKPAPMLRIFAYRLSPEALKCAQLQQQIPARQVVQRKLLLALQEGEKTEAQLKQLSSVWQKALMALMAQGWVEKFEWQASAPTHFPLNAQTLNAEQQAAVTGVLAQLSQFQAFLLYGVTGSGKTEVYMQILQQVLQKPDSQALILVPEINLTPQLEARFRQRFPHIPLVTLHSHLSDGERLHHWHQAQTGRARIVIGTRLSVFTPMPKLAIIIVDEEHDASFKQQDSMRYHARDIALVRAQQANVPILLGSATPSLESWQNAETGKFKRMVLPQRAVENASLPSIYTLNTATLPLQNGLSQPLIQALKVRLERGEQSLLFINRRGYAPVLLCSACHWIAPCSRCSSRLVVHLKQGKLRCHHCGHEQSIVRQCPSCGNADLQVTGQGTQRLEETLVKLFPQAKIARVDRDTISRKDALSDLLDKVHAQEIDILVGTQILAKGHDFPNLTLVGVLDTDSALFSPDFRASERLFAQLMQVAGRAGRADKAGEVLIQTSFPEHPLFTALVQQDYANYASKLMEERAIASFPPYTFMALIRAEATQYRDVDAFLQLAYAQVRAQAKQVTCYPPMRAQMERLKGMERGQIVLQSQQRGALQKLLSQLIAPLRESKLASRVRWHVDVDPMEF